MFSYRDIREDGASEYVEEAGSAVDDVVVRGERPQRAEREERGQRQQRPQRLQQRPHLAGAVAV